MFIKEYPWGKIHIYWFPEEFIVTFFLKSGYVNYDTINQIGEYCEGGICEQGYYFTVKVDKISKILKMIDFLNETYQQKIEKEKEILAQIEKTLNDRG